MLDVPCSERVRFFKSLIGLISGTSGVSHIKGGIGKQFYKSGILQLHLERVPPGKEICCESPECVRMSLSQAWRPQDSRRKWLIPQEQQSQGCQSNVSSSHGEKGRDRWTLWVIERHKLRKTKKKGKTCAKVTASLISPAFLHTDRSGDLVGFEVYALKQREEAMWPFQLCIKEVYGRRSGRTTPDAQPSTLHMASRLGAAQRLRRRQQRGRRQTEDKGNKSNRYHLLNTYSGDKSSAEHFYTYYIYSPSFIK